MKKRMIILAFTVLLGIFLAFGLSGCTGEKPPEGSSPEPPALNGTFSSSLGSLAFNGDGKSIQLDLNSEGAGALHLPEGKSQGSYVFLFRNESWRYDKAETFRIILEDGNHNFRNMPSETCESAIVFFPEEGTETVSFSKK